MLKKPVRKALCCALLVGAAGAASAASTEPVVLSDAALDTISAGYSYPVNVPLSAAFAYAFTSAFDTPGIRVIVDVNYSHNTAFPRAPGSGFSGTVTTYRP